MYYEHDMKLFFILGREPALSMAEIFAVVNRSLGKTVATDAFAKAAVSRETLRLELPETVQRDSLMETLGGTIKIGLITKTSPFPLDNQLLVREITDSILNTPGLEKRKRLRFGISPYGANIPSLGLAVKRMIEETGRAVRWVTSREKTLSSVVVKTNRLLTEGAEVVLIIEKNKLHIGRTVAVQPFEALEARDFPRPGRDQKSGMLPPKLARMMVNLAATPKSGTILDPFCGSGTIPVEALLVGYQNLIGTDLDPQAIKNTNQNLDWMVKNRFIPSAARDAIRTFPCDVRDLAKHLKPHSIDALVTEPFLGPPLTGREPRSFLEKTATELADLYRQSLTVFKALLTQDGRIVMVFPLIRSASTFLPSAIPTDLSSFGFRLTSPFPENFPIPKSFEGELGTEGKILIYGRPNQRVWREIAILERI